MGIAVVLEDVFSLWDWGKRKKTQVLGRMW